METKKPKKLLNILNFVLKFLITGFILWRIFHKMDTCLLWKTLLGQSVPILLAILGLSALRHFGQYLAWKYSLQMNPLYKPNHKEIFNSYMIGQAFRFIVPGSWGLVGKIAFVNNSSHTASFISYIVERSFVTWSMLFFASFSLFFVPIGFPTWLIWFLFILVLMIPFGGWFFLGANRRWKRLQPNYLKLGPRILLLQIAITLFNYLQYWLLINQQLLTNQHRVISFWETLKRMSLAHMSHSIPITFAGLGLKEYFAKSLFAQIGYPDEAIVSTTLIVFFLHDVLAAIAGAGILLQTKHSK